MIHVHKPIERETPEDTLVPSRERLGDHPFALLFKDLSRRGG
jgi:hypothetical protein